MPAPALMTNDGKGTMRQSQLRPLLSLFTILILMSTTLQAAQSVRGRVYSGKTGKPMPGVQIMLKDTGLGTVTGNDGRFRIDLPVGRYTFIFRFMGYKTTEKTINVEASRAPDFIEVRLEETFILGETVTITAQGEDGKTGKYTIPVQSIRDVPAPLPDALMAIKTLPGVFSQNDQSSFYSVRGGSYDDNLIMLNGIELYQPHLVRKAVAENPSAVNGALIESMSLMSGSSPVSIGDKTASVLNIAYRDSAETVKGSAKATTVTLEAMLEGPIGGFGHWMASARHIDYGYVFTGLRTEGQYNPRYTDFQGQLTLRPITGQTLKLFGIKANSRYRALPEAENAQWDPISQSIFYDFYMDGHEHFDYETEAWRAAWQSRWSEAFSTTFDATRYNQVEREDAHLRYSTTSAFPDLPDDVVLPDSIWAFLQDREEIYKNRLELEARRLSASAQFRTGSHRFRLGGDLKRVTYDDSRYEEVQGDVLLITDPPAPISLSGAFVAETQSMWLEHRWQLSPLISMTWGVRRLHTDFNDETLWLPRWRLDWTLSEQTDIAFTAGRYAQPPLYKELLNVDAGDRAGVLAQKAVQAGIGFRHTWQPDFSLKAELFAKKMTDLISYDLWDVRAVYSGENDARGYVYGVDAQFTGPFIPDCTSWLSYQYLVARENLYGDGEGWVPRPADQRHTLALNFQDKMVRFPGSRLHVRLILGSGTYFTYRYKVEDEAGNAYLGSGPRNKYKLPYYQRFDIGFTQRFKWKGMEVTCREEVLNLFNRRNTLGYTWFAHQLLKRYLSGRVFNIGIEVIL